MEELSKDMKKTLFYVLNTLWKFKKKKDRNPVRNYFSDGQILNERDMCSFFRKIYGGYIEIHNFVIPKIVKQGGKVLEIACGIGLNYDRFKYYKEIIEYVGVDTSSSAINYAKIRYGNKFIRSDGRKTPFTDHCFDVSFALSVADHLENYKELLTEMIRITKKMIIIAFYRGLIDRNNINKYNIEQPERLKHIIDSYEKDKTGKYIYYMNQYSKEELIKYLKENFIDWKYSINTVKTPQDSEKLNADILILTKSI